MFDPLAYRHGRGRSRRDRHASKAVAAKVWIRYESATVGGVSVPKTVAQELLRFYTRTEERPRGFAFDEPLGLPAGLRAVSAERGAATVMQ